MRTAVKQKTVRKKTSRRTWSFQWHFHLSGQKIKVCKPFYMDTLGIKEETVRTACEKITEGILVEDRRGKHGKHKKLPPNLRQGISDHINSFPRIESHYLRAQTKREYLEDDLNLAKMYDLYVDQCKERHQAFAKKWVYSEVFK